MSLLNQDSLLLYDRKDNIHHLLERGGEVSYTFYENKTRKATTLPFADNIKKLAGFIDEEDTLHIISLSEDGELIYHQILGGIDTKENIGEALGMKEVTGISDMEVYKLDGQRNIVCGVVSNPIENGYALIRFFEAEGQWQAEKILEFYAGQYQSEIGIIRREYAAYIFLVDKGSNESSLMVYCHRSDSVGGGFNKIAQFTELREIYWYDVFIEEGKEGLIEAVYSFEEEGNFSLKYVRLNGSIGKIQKEVILSEGENCVHPVFLSYMGEKWILWFENGAVFSVPLENNMFGEGVLKWKESVGENLLLHHFSISQKKIKPDRNMECRKLYCIYPQNRMIGFGNYKRDAVFMKREGLGKKKMEEEVVALVVKDRPPDSKQQEIETKPPVRNAIEERVTIMEARLEKLEHTIIRCRKLR